jgi:hypothetical protein
MAECGHYAIASIACDVSDSISAVKDATRTTQQTFAKFHLGLVIR